jgi:hypothetical protein
VGLRHVSARRAAHHGSTAAGKGISSSQTVSCRGYAIGAHYLQHLDINAFAYISF